jgi:hypothetical protein
MKKLLFPTYLLSGVMVVSGIRIFQSGLGESTDGMLAAEITHVTALVILFIVGIIFGIVKRSRSKEAGFPEDDELSIKIIRKSASISFYASLFVWLILLFIRSFIDVDSRILFSFGFVGMSMSYVIVFLILSSTGIKDA